MLTACDQPVVDLLDWADALGLRGRVGVAGGGGEDDAFGVLFDVEDLLVLVEAVCVPHSA